MYKNIVLLALLCLLSIDCNNREEQNFTNTNKNNTIEPSTPINNKPSNDQLGTRGYAQEWKVDKKIYLNALDVSDLYNNPLNTVEQLKKLVTFAVTPNEGGYYVLKNDELKNLSIENIHYDGRHITFYTKYKNIKSHIKSTLNFDTTDFYNEKIIINNDYISTHYMRGIYESLPVGMGNLLIYDEQRYIIDYVDGSRYKDDYNNTLRLGINITDKKISNNNNNKANISKEINGFKTLNTLAKELSIGYNYPFVEYIKNKIKKNPNTTDFTQSLKGIFTNKWTEFITIYLKSDPNYGSLSLIDKYGTLSGKDLGRLDILLYQPRFILNSAILEGNNLHIIIQFQLANDIVIDKSFDLFIRNIK